MDEFNKKIEYLKNDLKHSPKNFYDKDFNLQIFYQEKFNRDQRLKLKLKKANEIDGVE